jgi:SAM-dependent methyltransferase
MDHERSRWEERYSSAESGSPGTPSLFLRENLHKLPNGRALDVACGDGRHALFLARSGYRVDAIDQALAAVKQVHATAVRNRLPVNAIQADLEHYPLRNERYDLIVNIRYLQRSLWPALKTALRDGGVLVFETFTTAQQRLGPPHNPAFLLRPGELREAFRDLELIEYQEGRFEAESGPAHLARLLARRPPRASA